MLLQHCVLICASDNNKELMNLTKSSKISNAKNDENSISESSLKASCHMIIDEKKIPMNFGNMSY